jgi:hypothetical protein
MAPMLMYNDVHVTVVIVHGSSLALATPCMDWLDLAKVVETGTLFWATLCLAHRLSLCAGRRGGRGGGCCMLGRPRQNLFLVAGDEIVPLESKMHI